jgi:hypothetical protein
MSRNVFAVVSQCFQSPDFAVKAANELGKAYAEGVNRPEDYTPYDASSPQKVAMDLAGLYAADTAANLIAAKAGALVDGKIDEDTYVKALESLAAGDLDDEERYIAKNAANATWRAGQPFRDIMNKPLSRITRDINQQFNTLPVDEEDKDLVQTKRGAELLLEAINS